MFMVQMEVKVILGLLYKSSEIWFKYIEWGKQEVCYVVI